MSRRTTGVALIAIATVLYCTHFLTAAIFGSGINTWNADLFNAMRQYIGNGLTRWSTVALVVGVIYLAWAEIDAFRSRSH
jgi:hypothetical protein